YDAASGTVLFDAMCGALERLPAGTVVLLHGSCHNPTGQDLDPGQWRELAALLERRALVPLVDLAYQGLGEGLEPDAASVRLLAERLPELLVAASCSKNFGLYRERVGAVLVITPTSREAGIVMGHLQMLARRMYSFPPDHGAALVAAIAADPLLRAQWSEELDGMRTRVAALRTALAGALRQACGSGRFDFIARQRGMFSLLGIAPEAVQALQSRHHVYIAADSRINLAGLPESQIERVARAIHAVAP
ncbi:MAG: aminotransferase class I/II-fold pyridoxal phosphate-dependent enzyme, partial [Proteobacteria bacterium]|nr:aminotransferase class I/II-fold pyridoxal phosphate-dependent enzyme [Pseudomonadota bacterium]